MLLSILDKNYRLLWLLALALVVTLPSSHVNARALSQEELDERQRQDEERRRLRLERQKQKGVTTIQQEPLLTIPIGILILEKDIPPALSNLDPIVQKEGFDGAILAIEDNNTTGNFIRHRYQLESVFVSTDQDPLMAFRQLATKTDFIIVAAPKDVLLALADLPEAADKIIFNISAQDDSLRNQECRANMLHILPSRAMRADAITQFLLSKNWTRWFLIKGTEPADEAFAAAIKRAAQILRIDIVAESVWDSAADIRRTASAEVPRFTKKAPNHDVMILADEQGLFGEYLVWNSWQPRLVAGTQGLIAVSWHRNHERWGAAQMQNRFRRKAKRWMGEWDYGAWVAIRSLGEAVTRLQKKNPQDIRAYLLSDAFAIAAYKGIKVTYRPWNGQLRQPVLLASPRSMVAVAPQKKFLHPRTPLDTLGYDKPMTNCNRFS